MEDLKGRKEDAKKRILDIVAAAYDARLISKEHSHGEVVYTIRIPHENLDKYCMASVHDL